MGGLALSILTLDCRGKLGNNHAIGTTTNDGKVE